MNKDEGGVGGASALVLPPKTSDVRAPAMERGASSQPPLPSGEDAPAMDAISKLPIGNSNMNNKSKNRIVARTNYRAIDVTKSDRGKLKAPSTASFTPMTSPLVPMATSSPQLFIPAPSKSLSFNYSHWSRFRVKFSFFELQQIRCFKTLKKIYNWVLKENLLESKTLPLSRQLTIQPLQWISWLRQQHHRLETSWRIRRKQ